MEMKVEIQKRLDASFTLDVSLNAPPVTEPRVMARSVPFTQIAA